MRGVSAFFPVVMLALSACSDEPSPEIAAALPVKTATYEELIKRANCLACHQAGNQMGSPTWADVVARYKNNKDAGILLSNKITQGGAGAWGKMDMPPYRADLTDAEIDILVRGILAEKSAK
ncbi:MAG: c-type cytochrome [Gallionella sp.]|nr:c-type cytochrome [Gallionella sp.]MDP1939165.1 c-type cytochrome [Gallionella sp.]